MTEKRKFNPISPILIMGGGGRGEADVLENGQKREKSHYFCS
jgi:hypothetical protein